MCSKALSEQKLYAIMFIEASVAIIMVNGVKPNWNLFINNKHISPAILLKSVNINVAPIVLPQAFWYLLLNKNCTPNKITEQVIIA